MKNLLFISAFVLYIGNYHICEFFCGDDLPAWYKLRAIIYTGTFAALFAALNYDASGWKRFFLNVAFSIVVSDLIDRIFFDITTYEWKDILTIILTLSTSFYVWKYKTN